VRSRERRLQSRERGACRAERDAYRAEREAPQSGNGGGTQQKRRRHTAETEAAHSRNGGGTQSRNREVDPEDTIWLIVTDLKDMDYELTTINVFAGILYSSLLYWRSYPSYQTSHNAVASWLFGTEDNA